MEKITLAAARVNAGFSQREASERLSVSNRTLCNWERGKSFPKQPDIEAMCKLYGRTYDSITFSTK
jgi:transcriptional regulator with XRE-family HTH domain